MTDTTTIDLLCQRMIEDMTARKLGPASQMRNLGESGHLFWRNPATHSD